MQYGSNALPANLKWSGLMYEEIKYDDFLVVEELIPIMIRSIGISVYDFDFRNFFNCKSIWRSVDRPVVGRVGAFGEYERIYELLNNEGIILLHTPEEHKRCYAIGVQMIG